MSDKFSQTTERKLANEELTVEYAQEMINRVQAEIYIHKEMCEECCMRDTSRICTFCRELINLIVKQSKWIAILKQLQGERNTLLEEMGYD